MKEPFYTDSADVFFGILARAVSDRTDIKAVYKQFSDCLSRFLGERTATSQLVFAGPFARMDYLLKAKDAKWQLVKAANDTRSHIHHYRSTSDDELKAMCLSDLKGLCQFISFIDNAAIPEQLVRLFPAESYQPKPKRKVVADVLRMLVDHWDDTYIYGQTEDNTVEGGTQVCYTKGNQSFPFDWSYIAKLLSKGAQVNLVRPHTDEDGTIFPELIILEPDYLINVTTVANCFTNYTDSPLVALINRIKPFNESQPTLLGNFASMLLDEELNGNPWPSDEKEIKDHYRKITEKFFKEKALGMLTTEIDSASFHADAKKQAAHIHKAMSQILTAEHGYDASLGIVEPSFFSEMLGLQGRMDFLQMDFKFLMEQKSGKGEFPYDDFIVPKLKIEHAVQLQLYMLLLRYNYRKAYESNRKDFQPFLLYSKYEKPLLRVNFMPELIFNAIKIRNGLAWLEMYLAKPKNYRILSTLTPEKLNTKNCSGKLWNNYLRPQLAQLLSVFHSPDVTDTELAYFYRFMTFISNEHLFSKLGNNSKECSGFASTWHNTLEEKRIAGNIFDNLTLVSPDPNASLSNDNQNIESVELQYADDIDNDVANFRRGDIVILYSYDRGTVPDARYSMVLRCSIKEIAKDNRIVLTLKQPQSDARLFRHERDRVWAIEHDFMEASYNGLFKGMYSFLTAPKDRRQLLMFEREPQTDTSRSLLGDYGAFNDLALRAKQARDFFLIIGPPGTGKTSFGLMSTLREELLEPDSSILLMSYTNRAVDEICSKLVEAGIDFMRIGPEASCPDAYQSYLLSERLSGIEHLSDVRDRLVENRVYVGTTTSVSSQLNLFQLKHFDLAIIDEASQILEPYLIPILCARHGDKPAISKFVMIGDSKQLPAVVQQPQAISAVSDERLNKICLTDCRYSLFERLLRRYGDNPEVTFMLTKQGRMHPDVAEFVNREFYKGRLDIVPLEHQTESLPLNGKGENGIDDLLTTRHLAFISSELPEDAPSDKVNPSEARMAAALIYHIYNNVEKEFDPDRTVGVIVPYRNQISAVRKAIDAYDADILHNITIDTVERFQGSQRKYIIYCFTIQKYYQLNFLTSNVFMDIDETLVDRKLNVAMTRAEDHLFMIGHAPLLKADATFAQLINYTKGIGSYIEVSAEDFVKGNFRLPDRH